MSLTLFLQAKLMAQHIDVGDLDFDSAGEADGDEEGGSGATIVSYCVDVGDHGDEHDGDEESSGNLCHGCHRHSLGGKCYVSPAQAVAWALPHQRGEIA